MEATVIPSNGGSYAKGRNGYFKVAQYQVEQGGVGSYAGKVLVSIESKRASWPGAAFLDLSPEDAETLADALKETAVLARGEAPEKREGVVKP